MHKFKANIDIIIGNPFVYVPEKILKLIFKEAGKEKGTIPVYGKINGAEFKQTLVRYSGDWRLYINGIMLKAGGIDFKWGEMNEVVGKEIEIELEFDPVSRKLPMHKDLRKALDKDLKAKAAYDELAPYRKFEILRYISFLKTQEKIDLNVYRIIKHLKGEETDGLYALMHRKKPIS